MTDYPVAGADEQTPSKAQYFSWINHTNEGSCESQTLAALSYFGWLRDEFGMKLDLYAWDAGNLDGASGTYEDLRTSKKLRLQYPNGYAPIAEAAEKIGVRLGVWCGPDGFGDTPEEEERRREQMISLCRDYHFGLFKIDGVCGQLRAEKQEAFGKMIAECRKYSPDLILLNHRLELGSALKYATTFLWGGEETYVDVHIRNAFTASHHRAFLFERGTVPGLKRLTEDHGVCLSSCMDGFTDDIVYQAFNRDLILAPEIYGNPWLLKDSEQALLAHLFRLHERWNPLLVEGMLLPEAIFGKNAVARGNGNTRILTFGNPTWEEKTVRIPLDGTIGLISRDRSAVILHHPETEVLGDFEYGQTVTVKIRPFRAALVEVGPADSVSARYPRNVSFHILHEDPEGNPTEIRILRDGKTDRIQRNPVKLGTFTTCAMPENEEQLFETAMFAVDNDSLEARSLRRAGPTSVPAVRKCRDEFFRQKTYLLRGCENAFAFDGREDTFYDGLSHHAYEHRLPYKGGCLRVDFGEKKEGTALSAEVEFFSCHETTQEVFPQQAPYAAEFSEDLLIWEESRPVETRVLDPEAEMQVVRTSVHDLYSVTGDRVVARYPVRRSAVRYMRMRNAPDHIFRISLLEGETRLPLRAPFANNLQPAYAVHRPVAAQRLSFRLLKEQWRPGCYLTVAVEGLCGEEGASVCLTVDGKNYGAPDRAPSFTSNMWECYVKRTEGYHSLYIPFTEEMTEKECVLTLLLSDPEHTELTADCYLCDSMTDPDDAPIESF